MKFTISPRRLTLALAIVVACLVAISLTGKIIENRFGDEVGGFNIGKVIDKLSLDSEQNIPTWYSGSALLFCAILLAVITSAKRAAGDRYARQWGFMGLIFVGLSLEEIVGFHELSPKFLRTMLHLRGLGGTIWVIPAAAFVVIFAIAYFKFLLDLPGRTRLLMIVAGIIFVMGAIGIEAITGFFVTFDNQLSLPYIILSTLEETCEMGGIALFVYTLTSYMRDHLKEFTVQVGD